jgi:hypothetical protein
MASNKEQKIKEQKMKSRNSAILIRSLSESANASASHFQENFRLPILKEVEWVKSFKKYPVSQSEAEAIVDSRLCSVVISYGQLDQRWKAEIYIQEQLVLTKTSALSNREGVVRGLWQPLDPSTRIPWTAIQQGQPWRTEEALLDYHFWIRCGLESVRSLREMLFLPTLSSSLH